MSKEDRSAFHFPGAVSLELISHEAREKEGERQRSMRVLREQGVLSLI